MREIGKFRGKRLDGGGWIRGSLLQNEDMSVIVVEFEEIACCGVADCPYTHGAVGFEVDPKTVGYGIEYNGQWFYEDDIVHVKINDCLTGQVIASGKTVIGFQGCKFGVKWGREFIALDGFCNATFEVIGNIHDNPELLEVEK